MKKRIFLLIVFIAGSVFAELTIVHTKFRKASLETVEEYAEKGNAEAQLELALRHYAGHQVPKDVQKAFQWMSCAAEGEHPEALLLLSQMVADGEGTSSDPQAAEAWYIRALVANPDGENVQEKFKEYLAAKEGSEKEKVAFLLNCANAGYLPAYTSAFLPMATNLYWSGKYDEARPLFEKLLDRGDSESAVYLARMYANGLGDIPMDDVEAFILYQQAAADGNERAQYELALRYAEGRGTAEDAQQAEFWYQKAAENGNADAQVQLAQIEFEASVMAESRALSKVRDDGVELEKEHQRRLGSAVKWYKAAAAQSHPDAQYMLGRLSASGEGVPKSYKQAVGHYEAAAAQGHSQALFYLGLMHHAGLGVPRDPSMAVSFYELAAEKGAAGALYYLGNCYRFGVGVPKNSMRGEGVYYGKLLQDRSTLDVWSRLAAREYGIILWQRADSSMRFVAAENWVGMAAQNGDELAADVFLEMKARDRRSYDLEPAERAAVELREHRADPASDAVKPCRVAVFFPYVQQPVGELYAKSMVSQKISFAEESVGANMNVAGAGMQGITVTYMRPPRPHAVGFSGIVLVGMEWTNRETGERYWAMGEHFDRDPLYDDISSTDLFAGIEQRVCPDAKLTGWAVVYGHLLPDGRTIAVFDTKEYRAKSLAELFERNSFSTAVESVVDSRLDPYSIINVGEDGGGEGSSILDLVDGLIPGD